MGVAVAKTELEFTTPVVWNGVLNKGEVFLVNEGWLSLESSPELETETCVIEISVLRDDDKGAAEEEL